MDFLFVSTAIFILIQELIYSIDIWTATSMCLRLEHQLLFSLWRIVYKWHQYRDCQTSRSSFVLYFPKLEMMYDANSESMHGGGCLNACFWTEGLKLHKVEPCSNLLHARCSESLKDLTKTRILNTEQISLIIRRHANDRISLITKQSLERKSLKPF